MAVKKKPVTGSAIKQAIERRNGRMLASFYADDAVVRVIDRNNPPSKPRTIKGRAAIDMFWGDICSRAMTHKVEMTIAVPRLHAGLLLSRRRAGLLRLSARAAGRPDRASDRGTSVG